MNKLLIALFLIFCFLFALFSYTFIDANFIYLRNFFEIFHISNRIIQTGIYFLLVSSFFLLYVFILRKKIYDGIKSLGFISGLLLLFSYPTMLSYDLFNYIATSRVSFLYQENPYVVMPIQLIGDPMLLFTQAANKTALYGPFWILLTGIPYFISSGSYILSIFFFKLLSVMFYFGLVFLIFKITKSKFSTVFFALNPLVLVEVFVSGHNDVVMMFLALLAFSAILRRNIFLSLIFIVLSILIKFSTILLLPILLYCIFKKIKHESVNWEKIWFLSFILMFLIFALSFIREEIYPWYAIWPMTFLALLPKKSNYIFIFIALTYGLMLRYTPYMLLGSHFGISPLLKFLAMIAPPLCGFIYLVISRKIKIKY